MPLHQERFATDTDDPPDIRKRDGRVVPYDPGRIAQAIRAACQAQLDFLPGSDDALDQTIRGVVASVETRLFRGASAGGVSAGPTDVETIQDAVERAMMAAGLHEPARRFIRYRERRRAARDTSALIEANSALFRGYLDDTDWQTRENANASRSVNGLNNYVREHFTKQYWLHEVYPDEVRRAHETGDLHLHDLGFLGAYCAGWDLRAILLEGFGGVEGKIESRPPKHLRTFLGQVVNFTFTAAGETAGAQAWSSIDTYAAPFIRHDSLSYEQVKQAVQEFVFNLNVPTRVGFQCPFSNLTFDLVPPAALAGQHAIIGGQPTAAKYGGFQPEMDLFNRAFCEVMLEGDAKGRVFTFPIPTINITRQFDWDSPAADAFFQIACKYGIPYFANYINADLSPEDALSMCCRLRLDKTQLRKRGGGLFGSNPLTGSVGVVTLNLPRVGYLAKSEDELFARVAALVETARTALEIKRKVVERHTERGLYPYCKHQLRDVRQRTGCYWFNHFSTVGVVGMHELLLNFLGPDHGIETAEGQRLSVRILESIRDRLVHIQDQTGHVYNLEATPAEGTAYRLALLDKRRYPDIRAAGCSQGPTSGGGGGGEPYYTNSTHLPVGFSDDIFEVLDLQDELQSLYTGGTVLHLYLGQRIDDVAAAKSLIRTAFRRHKLPYLSLTPTFSVCRTHGYHAGEHETCPTCGGACEVYTRVVGYLRPVAAFNKGKKQEHRDRVTYRGPSAHDPSCVG